MINGEVEVPGPGPSGDATLPIELAREDEWVANKLLLLLYVQQSSRVQLCIAYKKRDWFE
jgi:hypothetical protein